MATIRLPQDFKEFLKLLKEHIDFEECFQARIVDNLDGVEVNLIDLENLKRNKKASGILKVLTDFKKLP